MILDQGAPLGECRVDLTPRKCQKFKPARGDAFRWTCTAAVPPAAGDKKPSAGDILGSGTIEADRHGLVTIRQMRMRKGRQRVVIRR